jgi:hypothetical protein
MRASYHRVTRRAPRSDPRVPQGPCPAAVFPASGWQYESLHQRWRDRPRGSRPHLRRSDATAAPVRRYCAKATSRSPMYRSYPRAPWRHRQIASARIGPLCPLNCAWAGAIASTNPISTAQPIKRMRGAPSTSCGRVLLLPEHNPPPAERANQSSGNTNLVARRPCRCAALVPKVPISYLRQ